MRSAVINRIRDSLTTSSPADAPAAADGACAAAAAGAGGGAMVGAGRAVGTVAGAGSGPGRGGAVVGEAAMARSTSSRRIRPDAPGPVTDARSTPLSTASLRTTGDRTVPGWPLPASAGGVAGAVAVA